jgi:hypothetical protein
MVVPLGIGPTMNAWTDGPMDTVANDAWDRYGSLLTGMRRVRLGSWMHGIHLVIRSLRPLVRPVLARPGRAFRCCPGASLCPLRAA